MIGRILGKRYEIQREVGRGGMGVVYLAYDPLLEREVAIKVILGRTMTPEAEKRFQREAKLLAQMDHPAIVPVHDVGEEDEILFYVMPFIDGSSLRTYLRNRSLSMSDLMSVGIQIADALDYSHARRVIHRDIKPENILVQTEPGSDPKHRIRITDFGLATKILSHRVTEKGAVVGTVAYVSPEQVMGKEMDARSDIYSLGVVLYEYLAGDVPFAGEFQAVLYRIVYESPVPPRMMGVKVPLELEDLIMRCLDKDPEKRPQRAKDVAEMLSSFRRKIGESEISQSITLPPGGFLRERILFQTSYPLIGRDKEVTELSQRLTAAESGECQFVLIGGEAGIGKSRLAEEIEKLAKVRKFRTLHGRFYEQDQGFPYQGFCEVIQEYIFSKDSGEMPPKADFSDLADDLVALFPVLAETELFRTTSGSRAKPELKSAANSTQIFELLARAFLRIGSGRPLMIILEDLHNTQMSPEALEYVIRRLGPTPTLLIGTFHSTEVPRGHPLKKMIGNLQGERRFTVMNLNPLTVSDHRKFLETLLSGKTMEEGFSQKVYEATEGNPLFTVEMIRSMLDSAKGEENRMLSSEIDLGMDALPSTIQNVIEKRIKRLPEEYREILSLASVLGKSFRTRDLSLLLEGKDSIDDLLDRLIQDGFLAEEKGTTGGERLRFCSGVVQEILYASLSRRRRKSVHLRYAEEMERRNAGRLERVYPQLLHHYSYADVAPKVVEYGLKFARKSLAMFSVEEAVRSLKMVLEFGDGLLEGEARTLLATAHRMSGNVDSALQEYEETIRLMEHSNDPRVTETIYAAAETAWDSRRVDETLRWTERGLDASRRKKDTAQLSKFLSLAATVANLRGEYQKANEFLAELDEVKPAEVETVEEVASGGTLRAAVSSGVHSLDPAQIQVVEEVEIAANVYETLLTTDPTGHLRAGLCERWDVEEGGKAFLLTLRPNVRFHNGETMVSLDVKRSLERALLLRKDRLPPALSSILGAMDYVQGRVNTVVGIAPIYENRILIRLTEALPIYPSFLTHLAAAVVYPEDSALYGTGPFQIDSHEKDRIVLKRNEQYWKGKNANLASIEFSLNVSSGEIAKGLRDGRYDLASNLLPEDQEEILRDRNFRANLVENPKRNLYFVLINTNRPVFQDRDLRQRIADAVNIHDLVRQTIGRFARPAEGIIPPGILGHDPSRRKAVSVVAEIKKPVRLRAACHPFTLENYPTLVDGLLKSWSEAGIEVELVKYDREQYLQFAQNSEKIDLLIARWMADYDDPDTFTHGLFHSGTGLFRSYYSSQKLDAMLIEARHTQRPGARERLYRKIEDLLLAENAIVPLFHGIDFRVAGAQIRNLQLSGVAPYVNYSELGKLEISSADASRSAERGMITVPLWNGVKTLDPAVCAVAGQSDLTHPVFEPLTRQVEGGRIISWLASEFHAEDGNRTFRFWLRNHIRFHNGRTLNARDVRYSFERVLVSGSIARNALLGIRGASGFMERRSASLSGFLIHSAREFSVQLEHSNANFPVALSSPALAIVPEGTRNFEANWREGCSGTGPFRVMRLDPLRRLELEANPDYWRPGFPKSEGIVFIYNISPADISAGLRDGRYLLAWDMSPQDATGLRKEQPVGLHYAEMPALSTCFLALNAAHANVDERLRHRLFESIDPADLVQKSLGNLATPANGLIPPGLPGYQKRSRKRAKHPEVTEDIRKTHLRVLVHPSFDGPYRIFLEDLFRIFSAIGIVVIRVDSPADADLFVQRYVADFPDSGNILESIVHSKHGMFGEYFGDPVLDDLIERARLETDPVVMRERYSDIEKRVREKQLMLPLFHEKAYRFARPEVQGFGVNFFQPILQFENFSVHH